MTLADVRDLVIIIFAVFGLGATLVLISLALVIFFKVGPILDSTRSTIENLQAGSSFVSNTTVKPIIKVVSFAMGVRKAVSFIAKIGGEKRGKKSGE